MPTLDTLASQEKSNLEKLQRLEDEALSLTIKALSTEIETTFNEHVNPDDIDLTKATEQYTNIYTASMMVSWLLGQAHVIKSVDENIKQETELSSLIPPAPVYLAVDDVPFQEAIDALKATIPTDSIAFQQMEAAMKLRAFTVANVSSIDAINRVKKQYEAALESGASRSETLANMQQILEQEGLSKANPYYLELHYRNNMMTAYNAGRWTQIESNDLVSYLVYSSVLDSGTTELCRKLDNVVKPKDDPFWESFYPPNHHKCRATVSVLSSAQYDKLPASAKQASNQINAKELDSDATTGKEHQFTSSPIVSMKTIPASMMERANEYGLTQSILDYSKAQSSKVLNQQVKTASKQTLSASIVNQAIKQSPALEPFKEMINEQLMTSPDEVLFAFDELKEGDFLPSLMFVLELDESLRAVAFLSAYDESAVYKLVGMSKGNLNSIAFNSVR